MRRTGNVVPFPSDNPSGISLKVFAVILYVVLAFALTLLRGLSEDGLGLLIVLGLLYNFFVRRGIHKTNYFQKNKVLLIILLVVLILVFREMMILLLLLTAAYWFLVGRTGRDAPYFLRFHILTALILNMFILLPFLLLSAALGFIFSLLSLFHMGALVASAVVTVQTAVPLLFMGIFWGVAIWLCISVMMGRTPYVPVVTDNVRHWA